MSITKEILSMFEFSRNTKIALSVDIGARCIMYTIYRTTEVGLNLSLFKSFVYWLPRTTVCVWSVPFLCKTPG